MRKARVVFLLFLVLAAGALTALYGLQSGWFRPSSGMGEASEPSTQAPSDTKSAAVRPSFDIVRAEPDGSVIMAGRAEPGWTVTVESGGKTVGQAVADANGEWVVEPSGKLSKGEHALELRAHNAEGGRTLFSKQRLALSLSDPKRDQPLVALSEEGKSTRVLQMPAPSSDQAEIVVPGQPSAEAASLKTPGGKDAAGSGRVGFASVDYEDAEEKSMLHMSGQAAPGTRVMLYVDDQFNGISTSDATGSWIFSSNKRLTPGSHLLRADLLDKDTTKVVARAEVKFDRTAPSLALADDDNAKQAAFASSGPASAATVAGRQRDSVAAVGETPPGSGSSKAVIVVRSGDTLWQIAQRHYGNGAKYTEIFKSNRQQIRNPNWIYPSQKFEIPQ